MRTPNPALSPTEDSDRASPGGEAAGATACAHPAKTRRGEMLPTHPPRSWRAGRGKAPRQRALRPSRCNPAPQQVQPRALPVTSTQTCLPAAGVDTARSQC